MEWRIVRDSGRDFMQADGLVPAVIGRRGRHHGIPREGLRLAAHRAPVPVLATTSMFVPDTPGFAHGPEPSRGNRSRAGRLARTRMLREEAEATEAEAQVAEQAQRLALAAVTPEDLRSVLDQAARKSNLAAKRREEAETTEAEAQGGQHARMR